MRILPAIDIRAGQVVRLTRGDYDTTTVYASDPAAIARQFAETGCGDLHVVDLDGAKNGELSNFDAVRAITRATGMLVEIGGGIRSMERIERYISLGVGRCIIGTAAVSDPEFLKTALMEYGERIAVGVDAKDGLVAVSGWLRVTKIDSMEFCERLRDMGVKTVIYTDISRDGMLSGPNHEIYRALAGVEGLNVIASGGVTTVADVEKLNASGIYGAIIGKALYTGMISLKEALEVAGCLQKE